MHAVYNSTPVPNYPGYGTRLHRYSTFVSLNCVTSQQGDRFSTQSQQPVPTAVGHVLINGSVADYGTNPSYSSRGVTLRDHYSASSILTICRS